MSRRGKHIDPYMFVGLRGRLLLTEWATRTPLDEDVYSLAAKWSEMLGVASFGGDHNAIEHWAQGEAGGTWTQDGGEHLLAWVQVGLDISNPHAAVRGDDLERPVPIQSVTQVLHTVLGRVGKPNITEVAAALAIARVPATSDARLATGREWLLVGADPARRSRVLVTLDVTQMPHRYTSDQLISTIAPIAGTALGDVGVAPTPGARPSRRERADEPPPLWQIDNPRVAFECSIPTWDVIAAAWLIELVAWGCRNDALGGMLTITARRIQAHTG